MNRNTDASLGDADIFEVATHRVWCCAAYPSRITLAGRRDFQDDVVRGRGSFRFMKATSIVVALCSLAVSGFASEAPQRLSDGDSIHVVLLGQALIEHDPRQYLEAPLRTVTPILASADLVFTNLEVAVRNESCECVATREGVFFHGTGPVVLDYLRDIEIDMLSLANNHSWDYGATGIASTISEVADRGFTHAGTGANLREATAPGYRGVNGLRVAVIAMATVNNPPEAAATDTRPGVNLLGLDDQAGWDRNIAAIQEAARNADLVIVYQHFQVDDPGHWQQRWGARGGGRGGEPLREPWPAHAQWRRAVSRPTDFLRAR